MTTLDYRPFSRRVQADPYPYYRQLRDHAPVHHLPEENLWMLSRYDDVVAALRDPSTFSSERGMSDMLFGANGVSGRDVPDFMADMTAGGCSSPPIRPITARCAG